MNKTVLIAEAAMLETLTGILQRNGFKEEMAARCAAIFTANSVDGIYTHGINRFPRFVQYLQQGWVNPLATPTRTGGFGALEQWDGNSGPGPLNAVAATDRAMELATDNGIGCVALHHTNHWMRGGYYGWQAAQKGFAFIGWSNTIANMPPWGAVEARLGNNPLVIAVPLGAEALVLDMAQSQFSFGTLEQASQRGETLPVPGGFDTEGRPTTDPGAIIFSGRPMPIGYWKGAGLALLLDVLATLFSGGLATHQVTAQPSETNLSQVFIAVNLKQLPQFPLIQKALEQIIDDYKAAQPDGGRKVRYPGERVVQTRKENRENGIPVLQEVWDAVLQLSA